MVLKSRLPMPDWSASNHPEREALCRKFPLPDDHDVSKDPWFHEMDEAVAICNGTYSGVICPFRERCLHLSLVNNEGYGVFGGFLPIQRKWIRRNRFGVDPLIPPSTWDVSEEWRSIVPPPEFFEEDDEEDAAEEEDAE